MITKNQILAASYFLTTTVFNLLNRYALGLIHFHFPVFLTCSHAFFSSIATPYFHSKTAAPHSHRTTAPTSLLSRFHSPHKQTHATKQQQQQQQWGTTALIGLLFAADALFRNWALETLSLSLHQIIRAAAPALSCLLINALHHQVPSAMEVCGFFLLAGGMAAAVVDAQASGEATGVLLCLLSVVANAASMTLITCINMYGSTASAIHTTQKALYYASPITCLVLTPAWLVLERKGLVGYARHSPITTLCIVLFGSVLAATASVLHSSTALSFLDRNTSTSSNTSSTSSSGGKDSLASLALSQGRLVAIMMASAVLFNEGQAWSQRKSVGLAAAIAGVSLFTVAQLQQGNSVHMNWNNKKQDKRTKKKGDPRTMKTPLNKNKTNRSENYNNNNNDDDSGNEGGGATVTTPPATLPGLKTPTSRYPIAPGMESDTPFTKTRRRWRTPPSLSYV